MTDKTLKLVQAIERDEQQILKLQNGIKDKKLKIKELENSEILNNVSILTAKGFAVKDIIDAIKNNDKAKLIKYLSNSDTNPSSIENQSKEKINANQYQNQV